MTHIDRAPLELVTQALNFAAQQHAHQRRKGEAGEPYLNHLCEVANLLSLSTRGQDAELVAAGLLHDVVEDTGASRAEIESLFGADVASLVAGSPMSGRPAMRVRKLATAFGALP